MITYPLGSAAFPCSALVYGCMRIGGTREPTPIDDRQRAIAYQAIAAALEAGYTCFDHADFYRRSKSELVFGEYLRDHPGVRERIFIQSKCGMRGSYFDASADHLIASVEGSLRRLGIDRLDMLLLHRPDALVEPDEVARAIDHLVASGKLAHVGVSNHGVQQMALLRRHLRQPILANQIEFSLAHPHLVTEGLEVNLGRSAPSALAAGVLDYCRLHGIRVQAWSPFGGGRLWEPGSPALARIQALAETWGTSPEAVAIGWILRHPAGIQPIIGSCTPERIRAAAAGCAVRFDRQTWYELLTAAVGRPLP
jgi:predicted oxidoreductase